MFDLKSRTGLGGDNLTRQRIRLGASLEFAIAVLNPTGAVHPALGLVAGAFFWLISGAVLALVLSVIFGWVWVGLVAVVVACVIDVLAARGNSSDTIILHRLRVENSLRIFVYVVIFAAALARADHGIAATAVLAAGVGSYGSQSLYRLAARWLVRRQPALRYVPEGKQEQALVDFARAYMRGMLQSVPLVVIELVVIVVATIVVVEGHAALGCWIVATGWVASLAAAYANFREIWRLGADETVEALAADVQRFLDELAPEYVTYLSAGAGQSAYILNQWIPVIEEVPAPGFVLVRESTNLAPIQKTTLPVIHAPQTRHVEELTAGRVNVAYYLANAGKNVHLLREAAVKHVFLNHGDSDKSTSANPVSRVYDEVWVAGQAAIDRYESAGIVIPAKNYKIVGRPQMAALIVGPRQDSRRTLLYAPTFEGYYEESNYSSQERMGPQMISHILRRHPDLRIIFKPHPNNGVQRPGMITARVEIAEMLSHGDHLFVDPSSPVTLYDAFDQADLMISDISSVVTDFLYTERPVIVSNPTQMPHDLFVNTFPTQRYSYLLDGDLANLDEILDDTLGPDSMKADRISQKKHVLGDLPQGPMKAFVDESVRVNLESIAHTATIANRFRVSVGDVLLDAEADDSDEPDD